MKPEKRYTLKDLFAGRPASRRLFRIVRQYIESIGPVEINVTKTQVSFGVNTKFAWVWMPQVWIKKRPEKSITLTFDLPEQEKDSRIEQAVEPRAGRWTHHVIIQKESDLDSKVKHWLRKAYNSGKRDRRRNPRA
jgi:hypothetical protein